MPIAYQCTGCKTEFPRKWIGRCPACHYFYNDRQINSAIDGAEEAALIDGQVMSIQDAINQAHEYPRIETGMPGVDRLLGGGIVPGSGILVCGDPGIGKTTFLGQLCRTLAQRRETVLYISGEENTQQAALRFKRFGKFPARAQFLYATDLDAILEKIEEVKPSIVIVDSIQMIRVEEFIPGGATAINLGIRELLKYGRAERVSMFIVGQVNKDSAISGPRSLEHAVDVAWFFSGKKDRKQRTLKCEYKNRFGPTPAQVRFVMREEGLVEIPDAEPDEDEAPAPVIVPAPPLAPVPAPAAARSPTVPAPTPKVAALVLAENCTTPDCHGRPGVACTALDGTREVGFHASRIKAAESKAGKGGKVAKGKARGPVLRSVPLPPEDEPPGGPRAA